MRIPSTIAVAVLAATLLATGCGSQMQQGKAQADLKEADNQLQNGAIPQANTWTDRAIAQTPDDSDLFFGPKSGESATPELRWITKIYGEANDDPDLVRYAQQGALKFPNRAEAYLQQVDPLKRLGKAADARAAATKAAALLEVEMNKPGGNLSATTANALAAAYVDAGNVQKGLQDYQKAIVAYPSDAELYNGYAYLVADQNVQAQMPLAVTYAQKAIAIGQAQSYTDEAIGNIEDTLGWVLYRQGKYDEALRHMLKAVNGSPRTPELRYHLAMDYLAMDQKTAQKLGIDSTAAARAALKQLLQLNPTYADAKAALDKLPPAPPGSDFTDAGTLVDISPTPAAS